MQAKLAAVFGKHLVNAGHDVVVCNSRGPETLREFAAQLGPRAVAGTREDALGCEVVIPAVNWAQARKALEGIPWRGQILIDAMNAHAAMPPDVSAEGVARSIAALNGKVSSLIVAELSPGARVVKALNTVPMAWLSDFSEQKPETVQFVSGDDEDAKRIVKALLRSVGFEPIDLGSLAVGGSLCQIGGALLASTCD